MMLARLSFSTTTSQRPPKTLPRQLRISLIRTSSLAVEKHNTLINRVSAVMSPLTRVLLRVERFPVLLCDL